jgi:hypothetical protein
MSDPALERQANNLQEDRRFLGGFLLSLLRGMAWYGGIVLGGLALYVILAPLAGYSPISDRLGTGWIWPFFGIPPKLFWRNAMDWLTLPVTIQGFSLILVYWGSCALLIVLPLRIMQARGYHPRHFRLGAGIWTVLVTGCFGRFIIGLFPLDITCVVVTMIFAALATSRIVDSGNSLATPAGA